MGSVIGSALVTGATGFIGSHLVPALRARGVAVRALVRASSDRRVLEPHGVTYAVGDVTDPTALEDAVADVDAVFHLAALLKQPWHPAAAVTNADGVGHLMAASARRARPPIVVLASSLAAAGPSRDGQPLTETAPPRPVSAYGRSKLAGEEAARPFVGSVPTTIVRPPAVFGERDAAMLPLFRLAGRGIAIVPLGGDHPVSLVHVTDLVAALVAAAERGERVGERPGAGIYFVADSRTVRVRELGMLVGSAMGRTRIMVLRPPQAVATAVAAVSEAAARLRGGASIVNRDKMREIRAGAWIVDPAKACGDLGWWPAATLEERLATTAAWYRAHGWV